MKLDRLALLATLALLLNSTPAWSTEEDPIAEEETAASSTANRSEWDSALKEKYALTDQQLADLRAKGLNNPQIAIVSQLAKSSGKTTDQILAMRQEQKMGWGRIAKELGLSPGEIGRSVSSVRRHVRDDRIDARQERRRERREERAADRREKRRGKHKGE